MVRTIMILAASLALASCGTTTGTNGGGSSVIPTPASIANHTAADEQAMKGAELAYKLTRTAGALAVDTGLAKGSTLTTLRDLDNRLYQALVTARSAYRAFNSPGLLSAADNVRDLAGQIDTLLGDKP